MIIVSYLGRLMRRRIWCTCMPVGKLLTLMLHAVTCINRLSDHTSVTQQTLIFGHV